MKAIPLWFGLEISRVTQLLVSIASQKRCTIPVVYNFLDVIEDAKYKRREALADLAKKVSK